MPSSPGPRDLERPCDRNRNFPIYAITEVPYPTHIFSHCRLGVLRLVIAMGDIVAQVHETLHTKPQSLTRTFRPRNFLEDIVGAPKPKKSNQILWMRSLHPDKQPLMGDF